MAIPFRVRLAVYTAHEYQRDGGRVYGDRAFILFLNRLAERLEGMLVLGRVGPAVDRARYDLVPEIEFVELPHYESLARPIPASIAMTRSWRQAWHALAEVDAVWILGPHPFGVVLAALAVLRRRRVFLGVRQDTLQYVRARHPGSRFLLWAGALLEGTWRLLARVFPIVAVGPALAARYRHSRNVHDLTVSLIPSARLVSIETAEAREPGDEVTALSVGRLEEEKNPLMLVDLLAALRRAEAGGRDWRLLVCGEGPLQAELTRKLAERGLAEACDLRGYVPFAELLELYRSADVLVSTSWTEGFPQVFVEAFASGLPVVATDVGGIRQAAAGAVELVPAGDAEALAEAAGEVVADRDARRRLVRAGLRWVSTRTIEAEVERLTAFFEEAGDPVRIRTDSTPGAGETRS